MMADLPRRKPIPGGYQPPQYSSAAHVHSRSRTTSSNIFPTVLQPPRQQFPSNMQVHTYTSRRTPSQATFSTTASSGNGPVATRQTCQDLHRSVSARSGGSTQPLGYVALMRRQKATVWCDRAQHEDPRLLAAQKAAKVRATMEVIGGNAPGRVSSGGSASLAGGNRVAAKIRHHGKAGLVGYSPGDLVGGVGGVPMRLSATEVEGEDSDDDADSGNMQWHHRRTGSGRSSLGSNKKGMTYSRQSGASSTAGRWSSGNSPPGESVMEEDTPVPATHAQASDYFPADGGVDRTRSTGSGSSSERADAVGELGSEGAARLASNSLLKSTVTREKSVKNPEELRRRGSVDDRSMTLSHGRLYIANPDADSD